ncbi:MAG: hypothetical protein AAF329_16920, partial [Cyanobacteria bacterium P01_A01_bin.17]
PLEPTHYKSGSGGDLDCTLTTFRTYYYQERQQEAGPVSQKLGLAQVTDIDQWSRETSVSSELSERKISPSEDDDGVEISPEPSDFSYEDKMKAHRDLAQRMFAARRAELKQQRGQQ